MNKEKFLRYLKEKQMDLYYPNRIYDVPFDQFLAGYTIGLYARIIDQVKRGEFDD